MPTFNQLVRKRPEAAALQDGEPGLAGMPAEARRLHPRLHPDAQEAELGAAQSRPRSPDQRNRSHDLHSRRRPQPAGALDRADPRRPREGSAGRALSRDSRHAGCGRRRQPQAEPFEVRSQAAEGVTIQVKIRAVAAAMKQSQELEAKCQEKDISQSGRWQPIRSTAPIW